jgi:hypothetical protein
MKSIDFSHPGGFPLTQNELDYLQSAYSECLNAFARMGVADSSPVIICGMEYSVPTPGEVMVADGWFFRNGELVRFNGGRQSMGTGMVALLEVVTGTQSRTYFDGSSFGAIVEKEAVLRTGLPLSDATRFPYSSFKSFHAAFGQRGREQVWSSIVVETDVSAGGVTGTLYYKKNLLTGMLQLRGSLSAGNAQNFAASPYAGSYLAGTLPAAYSPASNVPITGYRYLSAMVKDDLGVAWINEIKITITAAGQILVGWIKPDAAVAGYEIVFNGMIPLD